MNERLIEECGTIELSKAGRYMLDEGYATMEQAIIAMREEEDRLGSD